jgi:DNA-binding Lrp family transcriptional regulator
MEALDEADIRLISALRKNSRATISELAEACGLSRPTVKKKLENLVKMGIITRFTVKLGACPRKRVNQLALLIKCGDDMVEELAANNNVDWIVRVMGDRYLVKLTFCELEDLRKFTDEIQIKLDVLEFLPVLGVIKDERRNIYPMFDVEYRCEMCNKITKNPVVLEEDIKDHLFCSEECKSKFPSERSAVSQTS